MPSLSRLTQPLLDTPQSIDVISDQVLQDRAITDLNNALKRSRHQPRRGRVLLFRAIHRRFAALLPAGHFLDGIRDFEITIAMPSTSRGSRCWRVLLRPVRQRLDRAASVNQASKLPQLERAPRLDASAIFRYRHDAARNRRLEPAAAEYRRRRRLSRHGNGS